VIRNSISQKIYSSIRQVYEIGDIITPKRDYLPKRKITDVRLDKHSFSKPTIVYSYVDEELDVTQDEILQGMVDDGTIQPKYQKQIMNFFNFNKEKGWFTYSKEITQQSLLLWRDKI